METMIKEDTFYRVNTEEEVETFIAEQKQKAIDNGYILKAYSSQYKEKKAKGEVIADAYLVKISKIYNEFWEE